ncbi:MAG: hypothetical protein AB1492_02925 [Bacillota bacterium]
MREKPVGALPAGLTYLGAIVGAGFASGRELLYFFARTGAGGLAGVAMAAIVLGCWGYFTMSLARSLRLPDYGALCAVACGRAGVFYDRLLTIITFSGLSVMIAGGGTVLAELTAIPYGVGTLLTALGIAVVVAGGLTRLIRVSVALVPVLVVLAAGFAWPHALLAKPTPLAGLSWPLWAILYASYNWLLSIGILTTLGRRTGSPGPAAAWGCVGTGGLAALIVLACQADLPRLAQCPAPMLELTRDHGLYACVLAAAILTTGVTQAMAVAVRFEPALGRLSVFAVALVALPLSRLGLIVLVERLYPLLATLGLPLMYVVARAWLQECRKKAPYVEGNSRTAS